MSMTLQIIPEENYLRVCISGEFLLSDANEAFLEMLEAIKQYKAKKVLVDCTCVRGSLSTMDRFMHSEFAARALLEHSTLGICFGYVATKPILDLQKFGETVALNRGVSVRVYDNIKDALRWLKIEPK